MTATRPNFSLGEVSYSTHLDVLLGVLEVIEESIVSPRDSRFLVCTGVRVAFRLPGLAAEETVQVGTLLMRTALFNSVALGALGLEDLRALLFAPLLRHGEFVSLSVEQTEHVGDGWETKGFQRMGLFVFFACLFFFD